MPHDAGSDTGRHRSQKRTWLNGVVECGGGITSAVQQDYQPQLTSGWPCRIMIWQGATCPSIRLMLALSVLPSKSIRLV